MMNEYIDFPEYEYDAYKERIANNKIIYTTRVSKEVNKYHLEQVYTSPFGNLKVISLSHFEEITDHPFLDELTDEQIKEINSYIQDDGYDVIGLLKI